MVSLSFVGELVIGALSFCTSPIDKGLIHHILVLKDRHGLAGRSVVESNVLVDLCFFISSFINPHPVSVEDH
jgi:hypothetical protein